MKHFIVYWHDTCQLNHKNLLHCLESDIYSILNNYHGVLSPATVIHIEEIDYKYANALKISSGIELLSGK